MWFLFWFLCLFLLVHLYCLCYTLHTNEITARWYGRIHMAFLMNIGSVSLRKGLACAIFTAEGPSGLFKVERSPRVIYGSGGCAFLLSFFPSSTQQGRTTPPC